MKHRLAKRRTIKPKTALSIAIVIPVVFCGGAIAASKQSPAKAPAKETKVRTIQAKLIKKTGARVPEVSATLDKSTYDTGATMTLTVNENIWATDTIKVSDSSGASWTRKSDARKVSVFTAKATKSATITVTLTRSWDNASDTATASYKVNAPSTGTPTTPTPTTPTTPPTTPPTSPPTTPKPSTDWAGYTPGKFYLGMACGGDCTTKANALGAGYGVHRTFKGWGNWNGMAKEIQADHAAGRLPWVSFKPPAAGAAGWSAITSGNYDNDLKALATMLKANDDKPVLVTFHHEPSNDGTEAEGKLWAAAYVHIHDLLKAEGVLGGNVADPPILQDWIFNPVNKTQDPANWATDAVLERIPFMGIDMYQEKNGDGFSVRIQRIIDWMADRGFKNKMVGIGETGSTASFGNVSAEKWLDDSLAWAASNTDKVVAVSYFNTELNSKPDVYWPLDESAAKMDVFRKWLNSSTTIN